MCVCVSVCVCATSGGNCIQYMTRVMAMTQSETAALSLKDALSSPQVNETVS